MPFATTTAPIKQSIFLHETSLANIQAHAAGLKPNQILFLSSQLPLHVMVLAASSLQPGRSLCLYPDIAPEAAQAVASRLTPGTFLYLPQHISLAAAIAASASLNIGVSLNLHDYTPIGIISAVADKLSPNRMLKLTSTCPIASVQAAASFLKAGAVLQLSADSSWNLVYAAIMSMHPHTIFSLPLNAPLEIQHYVTQLVRLRIQSLFSVSIARELRVSFLLGLLQSTLAPPSLDIPPRLLNQDPPVPQSNGESASDATFFQKRKRTAIIATEENKRAFTTEAGVSFHRP